MKFRFIALLALLAVVSPAQLTTDQRLADFRSLTDLYARRYASIQWKQTAINFDVLNLTPWTDRIKAVTNDLDFYDLMVEYVSSLVDAHDQYFLPSDFEAHLGFTVDIYDGKLLVDSIDRTVLSSSDFPFQIGDELVSVDGKTAADLVKLFSKYVTGGNPRTTQRFAAELITDRYQFEYPRAHEIGDTASVVILTQAGATATYSIPWTKIGLPLTGLGASAGPHASAQTLMMQSRRKRPSVAAPQASSTRAAHAQQVIENHRNYTRPGIINVRGFDELAPVFTLPKSFVQRLGKRTFDAYYTGTYTAPDGTRIGYLRIPDFSYLDEASLDREIKYFQANTDALIVDVMRNPGGDLCYAEATVSRLTTQNFQGVSAEFRVDWTDIADISYVLTYADDLGLDDDTIAQYKQYLSEYQKAFYDRPDGRTPKMPVCGSTADRTPATTNYSKPVMLLVDEMSVSSADMFAAMIQDNHIGTLFGYRTMGGGGSPESDAVGIYSEGGTSVTRTLAVRLHPVVTPEYPTTSYIENVGVRPDIAADYMTADNLINKGAAFVDAMTTAAVKLAKGN